MHTALSRCARLKKLILDISYQHTSFSRTTSLIAQLRCKSLEDLTLQFNQSPLNCYTYEDYEKDWRQLDDALQKHKFAQPPIVFSFSRPPVGIIPGKAPWIYVPGYIVHDDATWKDALPTVLPKTASQGSPSLCYLMDSAVTAPFNILYTV